MSNAHRMMTICRLIALLYSLIGALPALAAARPNILFLMADQMRGDCLGADGNKVIRTPHLDRLAAEGARFRCAYSSIPSCVPARTAILTGLAPWRHGMLAMRTMALKYEREMPALLADAGYYTMGIGKMHFHPQRALRGFHRVLLDESGRIGHPEFRSDYRAWFWSVAPTLDPDATGIGWNDYRGAIYALPEELHPTRWTANAAVAFLNEYKGQEPFFLKVSFARPHSPYDPPERFMRLYEDADVPPAAIGDWAERHNVTPKPNDFTIWRGNVGPEVARHSRRAYYGSVSFVDEQIGRILQTLEARGWMDNTLILFTSDHGDMLGDHYLWRKTYAYEGSARVPMLIRWPRSVDAPRGQVLTQPVELRDVLPTFLDAAGVPVAEGNFDGRSMLELIRGRAENWRRWIDLEHGQQYPDAGWWTALTDGEVKYIFYGSDGREQLFDLKNDPSELHDLSADGRYAATLSTWRERMVEHLSERGEPFVKDGRLVGPRPNVTYSPHFPK
ncbi:MAG TPA: arylsulfatase [Phycisphaerae bacterium]|nr:arylsulfatase [Phycisphaerae bacterium]HON67314.1 arylsulfatase [Phycisphaerae bacterium]HPP27883.1 arylsulfatase [Phycisphaerae bacterium]